MSTLKNLLLISVIFLSGPVIANDGAQAEPQHEAKEEKSEEHGKEKAESKTALAPWVEVENKVTELNSKIKSKQRSIQELIESKNKLPGNSPHLKELVKDLVKEHKELQGLVEEYHKKVALLKYRFPERNAQTDRSYKRLEVKSLDEMEQALGVDGKLNRNLKRMRGQFRLQGVVEVGVVAPSAREPASVKKEREPSIEEADAILLQK